MTDEKIYLEAGHFYCAVPAELVTGEVTLCAGVQFQRVDEDCCEIVLLDEHDVDRMTAPLETVDGE
jgi:hypothetical protein